MCLGIDTRREDLSCLAFNATENKFSSLPTEMSAEFCRNLCIGSYMVYRIQVYSLVETVFGGGCVLVLVNLFEKRFYMILCRAWVRFLWPKSSTRYDCNISQWS